MAEEFQARRRMTGEAMREVGRGHIMQGILRSLDFIVNLWEVTGAFKQDSAILR